MKSRRLVVPAIVAGSLGWFGNWALAEPVPDQPTLPEQLAPDRPFRTEPIPAEPAPARPYPNEPVPAQPAPDRLFPMEPAPAPPNPNGPDSPQPEASHGLTSFGMAAEVGGGVGGFAYTGATSQTSVSGTWNARLIFGTKTNFAVEAAYIGSSQGLNTLGVSDKAYLTSNGAEGLVRWNIVTAMFEPYLVGGAAWRHYNLTNSAYNSSDVQTQDDVAETPVGAGLNFHTGGFIVDLRGEYRPAFQATLIGNTNLSNWGVNGKLGFEF